MLFRVSNANTLSQFFLKIKILSNPIPVKMACLIMPEDYSTRVNPLQILGVEIDHCQSMAVLLVDIPL